MYRVFILDQTQRFRLLGIALIFLLMAPTTFARQLTENLERVNQLNELSRYNCEETGNKRKAEDSTGEAVGLAQQTISMAGDNPSNELLQADALAAYYRGLFFQLEGDGTEANRWLDMARSKAEELENSELVVKAEQAKENPLDKKKRPSIFNRAAAGINKTAKDLEITANLKFANVLETRGEIDEAIEQYEDVIELMKVSNHKKLKETQLKVSTLLNIKGEYEKAQDVITEALEGVVVEEPANQATDNTPEETVPSKEEPQEKIGDQIEITGGVVSGRDLPVTFSLRTDSLRKAQSELKKLSASFAKSKDFETAELYRNRYEALSKQIGEDSTRNANEIFQLQQQKKIAELSIQAQKDEKEVQVQLRNLYFGLGSLLLIAALVALYFYFAKRKEHLRLSEAYDDLDQTKNQLQKAEQHISSLLNQQVSKGVASQLIANKDDDVGKQRFVTIMFLDIRNFTTKAEKLSPNELIDFQNHVFGFMIDIVQKHHGYINQLLGDGFMAIFGAPISHGNDCQNAFVAAQEILSELDQRIETGSVEEMRLGIGLHAGNVVTGNVGNNVRKQYSVTGNTVIIASRVEQLNKEYESQLIITEDACDHLEEGTFENPEFLEVALKGRTKPIKITIAG